MEVAHSGFELNIGDMIFQLFSFGIIIGVIVLIVYLFINKKKRNTITNERLDRIEKKLDQLTDKK
ncbi:DUF4083 domain-containing protein [Bacillus sp. BGMRC 2118]|nr:DUF4083 domain-containing protein [Bacillus sp. BGMRC 2118]